MPRLTFSSVTRARGWRGLADDEKHPCYPHVGRSCVRAAGGGRGAGFGPAALVEVVAAWGCRVGAASADPDVWADPGARPRRAIA